MNPLLVIKYQLYLLQLEDYILKRYWKLLFKKGYFKQREPQRKDIVWTAKSVTIFIVSLMLIFFASMSIIEVSLLASLILLLVMIYAFMPFLYTISLFIILPVDFILKKLIIRKAKKIISKKNNLKIIGIAGSYGKTTIKNIISMIISKKYNTLSTPESINTPIGISRWIVKNLRNETEVLIVEMGEHYKGDIRYLCSITRPDFSVLTGINEAHLERLKSINDAIATVFEIVENSKKESLVLLNADDNNIIENYQKYVEDRKVEFYSKRKNKLSHTYIKNKKFDQEGVFWEIEINNMGKLKIPLLGEYVIGCIQAGIIIAKELNLSIKEIEKGIKDIKPIKHRLFPIKTQGALVIDDSYNGNPSGVREAISVLKRFNYRRKVYITPGLVELGAKTEKIHTEIGKSLAKSADIVILIKNSTTPYIMKGLNKEGFNPDNLLIFNSAKEAHSSLNGIIENNDAVLFQNDWGDQYL